MIYIFTLKQSSFFPPQRASPCENALARVNIYNRTVKSVPRANIQLILNSFGKSAPGEMQILGQNREQLKLKLKYISKQKAVLHIVRNTKPQVAATMKIFLMDFIHTKVVHHLIEKRKRKV